MKMKINASSNQNPNPNQNPEKKINLMSFLALGLMMILLGPHNDKAKAQNQTESEKQALRINLVEATAPAPKTSPSLGKKSFKGVPAAKDAKETQDIQDENLMAAIIEKILNNVKRIEIENEFHISYQSKMVANKPVQFLDIYQLNLGAIIQFDKDLKFFLSMEKNLDGNSLKLVPYLSLNTQNLYLVGKLEVNPKGKFIVRICNNYSESNDYCDPKRLSIMLSNQTFNTIKKLELGKITLNFNNLAGSNGYQFEGVCESFEEKYDKETASKIMAAKDCRFGGYYSFNPEIGFKIEYTYKNIKKQQ
ncbi:MAG: hypothetical protein J0M15_01430 [Deltaproteobacteria bacterium]|jgi:hypothetical protein|nr:hypothetical protein [Deltaproteobacteria bacterium]